MSLKTVKLRDCCGADLTPQSPPAGNVLTDCKILGLTSRNGREYLPEALRPAVALYEGRSVYFDHKDAKSEEPRRFIEKFGKFVNVRYVEGDGIRGDFVYNPKHLYAETFLGWVEFDPSQVGFSHCATGKVRETDNGVTQVTSIEGVESIDLVADPATTNGLREAMEPDVMTPPEDAAPMGDEKSYEDQLADLGASILRDKSMSPEEKLKKIKALLKLDSEAAPEKKESEDAPEKKPEDEKAEEAFKGILAKLNGVFEEQTKKLNAMFEAKFPVSAPPAHTKDKPLTVDQLMKGIK